MRARLHVCSWDAYTAVCAHMYVHVHTRMMHMLGINVCVNLDRHPHRGPCCARKPSMI